MASGRKMEVLASGRSGDPTGTWRNRGRIVFATTGPQIPSPIAPIQRSRLWRWSGIPSLDYQFDVTATGRTIKLLLVTDEFTRESLSTHEEDVERTLS
jgi:hypothetical protein